MLICLEQQQQQPDNPGEPMLSQWRDLSPVSTSRVDGVDGPSTRL